jgi:hypothetical protein
MKNVIALLLVLFSVLASLPAGAERPAGSTPPGDAKLVTLDTSSTNLPATYGAAANSIATAQVGRSNICVVNGATTKIYLTTGTTSNCTAGLDKWVVPASGSACYQGTKINSVICARSSSGSISSGVIDVVLW